MLRRGPKGFTLIELMIVVAVIAVLAAIAYPSYSRYAFRARRSEGQEFLLRIAAAEQRYYTNCNRYATAIAGTATTCGGGLGFSSNATANGYYTVADPTNLGATQQTFSLTATPALVQATDVCGNLTLTDTGVKSWSTTPAQTNGKCW
jgi:type IV pilus assembly protein PilE